jgi:hypothetical protein
MRPVQLKLKALLVRNQRAECALPLIVGIFNVRCFTTRNVCSIHVSKKCENFW